MDRRSFLGALCAAPVALPVAVAATSAETPNAVHKEISRKMLDVLKADLARYNDGFDKRVVAAVRKAQTERGL